LLRSLERFHIFLRIESLRWLGLVSAVLAVALSWLLFGVLWIAPLILLGILAAILILTRFRLSRRYRLIRYQLPAVIELLATTLRAGLSVRAALSQLVSQSSRPLSQELAMLDRMQRIGMPLDRALSTWSHRIPIQELQLLTFAINVSAASGGSLSDALDRLAASFRQRLILEEKVDALTAQGRLQAWVMVALPGLLALVLTLIDPDSMASLWMSREGHSVLLAVGCLELIGLVWIRRLIRIQE
jgi:tight adherence protein B